MNIGTKVVCKGVFAKDFSLVGTVEVTRFDMIGVRLENGNFKWFPKANVGRA
jgi:hypothetical protein